jgi:diguanylate cyclase (GGDEF)-like protein/PAS domain S-box-containing protein
MAAAYPYQPHLCQVSLVPGRSQGMTRQGNRNLYLWSVTIAGAAIVVFSSYRLPLARLDLRFFVLAGITLLISSRITLGLPRSKGRISVSDTFIFLTLLLFGGEAAVLLAAIEAFVSSVRFSKISLVRAFNSGVMAISTFVTASILQTFGPLSDLRGGYTANLIVALSLMALMQYATNSWLIAISVALNTGDSLWRSWHKNFLWTSITYFAGASAAGIVARLIGQLGFYALTTTTPIIIIIYLTYRTYLSNVETAAVQAEQARLHVEELNRYIAEQERIGKALEASEEHFRTAFDYAAIGMALVSPKGRWLRVNRTLCDIVGYSESDLLQSEFQAITHREDLGSALTEVYRMLAGASLTCQLETRYVHKLGHEVWALASVSLLRDGSGNPLHFIFQIQDITERKRAEAAIQTLSLVDELTGLYNRRGFMAFATQHLNSVNRSAKSLAIVYADLDGFKQINDSFGHKEGDRALVKTAELFKETFRSSDVLGRLGGDEFTVLASTEPEGGTETLIARLEQKFSGYNALKTTPYELSISIGVALLDRSEGQSLEDAIALADKAMYENKRRRKSIPEPQGSEGGELDEKIA